MTRASTVIHSVPRKSTVHHKRAFTLSTPHHHSLPVGCGECVVEAVVAVTNVSTVTVHHR